ncbi:MAG: Type-1 restriction enzyme R protein, partial [Candidatus Moranbacteria bacterium GW2011_GWF2_34_56]
TREIGFEEFIENYLIDKNKYIKRLPSIYDKALCFDKELILQFIKKSQEKSWEKLTEQHGEYTEEKFFKRLDEEIKSQGILDVLRKGIVDHGVRFDLAYFKPETKLNKENQRLYDANIFSVMRQVKYSEKNENSIDMVLFLNGLPIFTVELKNQLTGQSIKNGVSQYRTDRDPRETLLSFKRCLVHFAIDTDLAYMTTKLNGLKTYFLPFNRGDNNSAGNPVNSEGYKTAYMWEDIWQKDSILEIISQFVCLQKEEKEDEKGRKYETETLIFPRYHQLDAVRRLVADTRDNGMGKNYLIQHSAGSGKSNTIAWVAHRLAELHNEKNEKVFDSVIVVTDRRVLDRQLRITIMQFEQVSGVVKPIIEGSKELKKALEDGEKIIITTLQKFPVIVESIDKIQGSKFAVIIDEAHSSQTGESSKSLKQVLETSSLDEAAKEENFEKEETLEDKIIKEIRSRRSNTNNISFFAFTATPKQKTLEIFGMKNALDGKFYPFSLYSMKQAIEEKFILDVLKNYTTYQVYFSLLKKIQDDPEFKKKKAQRLILEYVERHEHAIEKKIDIIVKHFAAIITDKIDGRAKAMIVTKSRLHAVKFKLAMDKYLNENNYGYKSLVAFSGIVKDGELQYSEAQMNGIPEKNTAEEFKKDGFRFLIVAEKFQTGFDQPLLSAMYVDKKLGGVSAVQTLSRLNRTHVDKEDAFVLDFVNDTEEIKEAFQPYYTTTVLSEATDPNILHNLQRDILSFKIFSEQEIDVFVEEYFNNATPAKINSFLDDIVSRFDKHLPEERQDFKSKATDYRRKYSFISQIISFEDTSLEKLYIFLRFLIKKLPIEKSPLPIEVLESIDMESYKVVKKKEGKIELENEQGELYPMGDGGGAINNDEESALSKIIQDVNERFGTNFSDSDRVILNTLSTKLMQNKDLEGSIKTNSKEASRIKFNQIFQDELITMLNSHFDLYKKLDGSVELKEYVNQKMFDYVHKKVNSEKLEV